jgi:N-acetylglucosamine transport system substrate-binding protein
MVGALLGLLSIAGCTFRREVAGRTEIETAVFEGGYGIAWHRRMARIYEREHPGVRVDLWGDPRVDEKIKPRILRGDPPDLVNCGLPVWKLIVAGKLAPLDAELSSPAVGGGGTWGQTLTPGVLSAFRYRGHVYAMPSNLTAWVCWYDRRLFRQHGWQAPRTWSELLTLCDAIKASGIAPFAFQGKYVGGYSWPTLLSLYQRLVPFDRWYRLQDLQAGAFLDPEFVHAAGLLQELFKRGVPPAAMAMTHTESQLEWCNGRAAMVFCGLWLEHEMQNAIPPGFEMACFPVPAVEGGQGDPQAIYGGGAEHFFVFRQGHNPSGALDFLKFMLSADAAHSYVRELNTLSPVRGAANGVPVSAALKSAIDVLDRNTRFYSDRLTELYPSFGESVLPDALADLLSGRIAPERFAARLEAAADAIRRDPDIYKPPVMGVPE